MNKTHLYSVQTEKFGEVLRLDDDIKAARRWAWKALKVGPRNVRRVSSQPLCERCGSRPCCCKERT